jgi:hypothetical protein
VKFEASAATISIDGDTSDWAAIPGAQVTLGQIDFSLAGQPDDIGEIDPVDVTLKVAADSDNVYVLVEVPDDYDFVADDHGQSAALAVMFRIDDPAAPHMGTTEEDQESSLGKVDIWHWELDCGAGELSGGNDAASGNDPDCNLDDEYSTTPEDREDDGTAQAENNIAGVWDHTGRAQGAGAEGTWIFEMSRPLDTGDPDDARFQLGGAANLALAYWDADETADGWTAAGHVQSSTGGWIQVTMPTVAEVPLKASAATISIDGDTSDWAAIPGAQVTLQQVKPIPGLDMGQLDPVQSTLKVAADSDNVYVLVEVPDDYDFVADDHGMSAALAVMFRIDDPAAPHMGTTEEDQESSLGKVDIWHWELDCGAGELSGGNDAASGNDPDCNLDDEFSTTPEDREDDGTAQAENNIAGVWEHTARAQGAGAEGTWIFEMSRPLDTGDPDDAQFQLGGAANLALAYWDADETADGWTAAGHVQSSTGGWIQVTMPAASA